MRTTLLTSVMTLFIAASGIVHAGPINPFASCLNINGALHHIAQGCFMEDETNIPSAAPAHVTDGIEADPGALESGLGLVEIALNEVGDFFIGLFLDWDIDEGFNFFFNEGANNGGALAAGQSFEVDEPGWVDHDDPDFYGGDIDLHFLSGALDGTVLQHTGAGDSGGVEEDISLALGWDFSLAAGQSAIVTFLLSDTQPDSGFWLSHSDLEAEITFFYSSTLQIRGDEPPPTSVPEPGTVFLLGAALLGVRLMRRRQTLQI